MLTKSACLCFSIGGDKSLETVTTLPSKSLAQVRAVGLGGLGGFLGHFIISRQRGLTDILRKFNPQLTGFSTGTGDASKPGAAFNQAVPGSTAKDLLQQVQKLVTIMKEDKIPHSAKNFARQVQAALDILHSEVPRVFVNLVDVLHVIPLRTFHQDSSLKCPTRLVKILCPCVVKPRENSTELHGLATLNRAYQEALRALVSSGRYDTSDDFTVVLQPFFRDVPTPLTEDGRPDRSFFSADCFHLSQKSHSQMARALWNNMVREVTLPVSLIGGDDALDKVTTLPNILRRFNSKLVGFSLGTGKEQSHLNMAVSGAKAA
ncbi:PLB1 Phospholipase, partial [Polypterus senegalus]